MLALLCLLFNWHAVVVAEEDPATLRFGVLSIAPPARIHANWQGFVEYLSGQLGRPVTLVVPRGFGKMKEAVDSGAVDLFYVNSHVFYRLKSEGRAVPVAQMENVEGHVTSRSQIFVRSDSGIETVEQLQGKRLAFISPMGAGGYLAPRAYLRRMGVNTGEEVFTRNLSSSLHEVLLGDIDAGTMCGVNYRLMSRKLDTGELRVIGVSDEYPENLVAARSDLAPGLVRQVATILLAMDDTPDGSEVLTAMHGMKIGRFRPYDPAVEAITRKLIQQAQVGH